MAMLDHYRSTGRQHPARSALCFGVTIAGLVGLAITISWLMNFVQL